MIPNMPTVGIRFDIARMNAATHAEDAWKAFWRAVDPAVITESLLFDGDVAGGVFYIAVQSMDTAALAAVEGAVAASDECKSICADPMVAKGEQAMKESLAMAGNVDSNGNLIGDPGPAHSALAAARAEKGAAGAAEPVAKPAPPAGAQPASELSRGFATRATTIGSHAARAALSGGVMRPAVSAVPKKSTVARKKKSSVGKTIAYVLVAIVVLGLIALMIFGPEPPGAEPQGVRQPASKARAQEAAPAAATTRPAQTADEPKPAAPTEENAAPPAADETDAATDQDTSE